MEMVYGRGYLSAGGDAEVARVLQGYELQQRRVLDLGCGLGGASVSMVRDLGATNVVGFDIDEVVLGKAKILIEECEVDGRVELIHGRPGPLEFSNASFDIVYMTAVACHMENLAEFFTEIARVLKPGGWLTGSDWMIREKNEAYHVWDKLLRDRGLYFYFVDQSAFSAALTTTGYSQIRFEDRTQAFTDFSAASSRRIEEELKPSLLASLGQRGYRDFKQWADVRYAGLEEGGMYYQHFHARRQQ